VAAKVDAIASAIEGLGLGKQSAVGVYGINCPEWMITMQVLP
jgi:long-subunit acyl-CoA synthetase (AMP-forming)